MTNEKCTSHFKRKSKLCVMKKNFTITINVLYFDAYSTMINQIPLLDIKRKLIHRTQVGGTYTCTCTLDKAQLLTRRLLHRKCSTKKFISDYM